MSTWGRPDPHVNQNSCFPAPLSASHRCPMFCCPGLCYPSGLDLQALFFLCVQDYGSPGSRVSRSSAPGFSSPLHHQKCSQDLSFATQILVPKLESTTAPLKSCMLLEVFCCCQKALERFQEQTVPQPKGPSCEVRECVCCVHWVKSTVPLGIFSLSLLGRYRRRLCQICLSQCLLQASLHV